MDMDYEIYHDSGDINGIINLPSSKSISNRALLIQALSYSPYPVLNLSDSDDTKALQQVFTSNSNIFDIGHAGTTMRFLTAFLSRVVGEWVLTGSSRMKQRPIGILVDALRKLGAKIEYIENEGYPPLKILGSHLKGGLLEMDGSVSSQYISALLMIGPLVDGGLTIHLVNKIASRSYIDMTLKLMAYFGISYEWKGNKIHIPQQDYSPMEYDVEGDWSGTSYWYQMLALAKSGKVELLNLKIPGLQGDSIVAEWFLDFGISSMQTSKSIVISKISDRKPKFLQLDFIENPDIAQTMAVLCVLKEVPFHFRGLETLKIKETDRIAALQNELAKFGAALKEPAHGELSWDGSFTLPIEKKPEILTYHDHRMAMAFAPAALIGKVIIRDPHVVTKSYPSFFDDMKKVGFTIRQFDV